MKLKLVLLMSLIYLTSCSNFTTSVNIEIIMPPLDKGVPIYVYDINSTELPDSAVYIGNFSASKSAASNLNFGYKGLRVPVGYGAENIPELYKSITDKARPAGANLIIIDKNESYVEGTIFNGKFYKINEFETSKYSEKSIKEIWSARKPDKFEGIYENLYFGYKVNYCIFKKDSNNYQMIYLSGLLGRSDTWQVLTLDSMWHEGDIAGYIHKKANSEQFLAKIYEYNKYLNGKCTIKNNDGNLYISGLQSFNSIRKIYPDSSKPEPVVTTINGFAINQNRIVTYNFGNVSKDTKIFIKGIKGNLNEKYQAIVEKIDPKNNFTVLKLLDTTILINPAPLAVSEYTTGTTTDVIIQGYQGMYTKIDDISTITGHITQFISVLDKSDVYRIAANIQPANRGSAIFDLNGNFLGMITPYHDIIENNCYALKLKCLNEFLTESGYNFQSKPRDFYKKLSEYERLKIVQQSIFPIEIHDRFER